MVVFKQRSDPMISEVFSSANDSMIEDPHDNYRCECNDFLRMHMANKDSSGVMPSLEVYASI